MTSIAKCFQDQSNIYVYFNFSWHTHLFIEEMAQIGLLENTTLSKITAQLKLAEFANSSLDFDQDLFSQYNQNLAVSNTTYWALIVAYGIWIVFGTLGNIFVISIVIVNKRK